MASGSGRRSTTVVASGWREGQGAQARIGCPAGTAPTSQLGYTSIARAHSRRPSRTSSRSTARKAAASSGAQAGPRGR